MSEKRTSHSADLEQTQQPANAAPQAVRRRLLKGSVAIPVIMTLHSGAALARTSNLVNPVTDVNQAATMTIDGDSSEKIVCAIYEETDQVNPPPYDLGESPQAFLVDKPSQEVESSATTESAESSTGPGRRNRAAGGTISQSSADSSNGLNFDDPCGGYGIMISQATYASLAPLGGLISAPRNF